MYARVGGMARTVMQCRVKVASEQMKVCWLLATRTCWTRATIHALPATSLERHRALSGSSSPVLL